MHNQLKQYLGEVEQGLKGLSVEQQQNELAELRSHLEAMAQANQELGTSEDEAYRQAIQQFGTSLDISHELETVQRAGWRKWGETALYALGASTIGYVLGRMLAMGLQTFLPMRPIPSFPAGTAVVVTYLYVLPFITGAIALAYLLYRNGWRRLVSTMRRTDSPMAVAALWVLISHLITIVPSTILSSNAFTNVVQWLDNRFWHAGIAHTTAALYIPIIFLSVFLSGIAVAKVAPGPARIKTIFQGIGVASLVAFASACLGNLVRYVSLQDGGLPLNLDVIQSFMGTWAIVALYSLLTFLIAMGGVLVVRRPKLSTLRNVRA